jgi:Resolvase, N terminal domain
MKRIAKPVRCAIYTRVSTDQGLEQDFNSLDAQYDASQAYIRSQALAGWSLLRAKYEDGGFSGGNTDRPALRQLLDDVRAGKVDVIVVYKVDRLTRSLADFRIRGRPSPHHLPQLSTAWQPQPAPGRLAQTGHRHQGSHPQVRNEGRRHSIHARSACPPAPQPVLPWGSPVAYDCVVGLAGLEPPTRPLWRDAPAPRTPQWDIFDWPGQEERACDVGSTVETSVPMPEPGVFRLRAVGAPAWRTSDCCSHDSESL